jgi:hypothetical protein
MKTYTKHSDVDSRYAVGFCERVEEHGDSVRVNHAGVDWRPLEKERVEFCWLVMGATFRATWGCGLVVVVVVVGDRAADPNLYTS